jgi:DNA replication protein DnaC
MKRELTAYFRISRRYEKSSTILTSNKSMENGERFQDHVIAAAVLDRGSPS